MGVFQEKFLIYLREYIMKKIILLAAIALTAGCAVIKPTERKIYTDFADYSAYSEIGFLITPHAYSGEYESLGELAISIVPAIKQFSGGGEQYDYRGKYYDYETIKRQDAIDIAVKEAINRGANAITNFTITTKEISRGDGLGTLCIGYEYYITGFCIKRK